MGVRVKALETGFYDGARRRAGDEFELRDGAKPGKWMQVVESKPAEKPAAAAPAKKPAPSKPAVSEDLA